MNEFCRNFGIALRANIQDGGVQEELESIKNIENIFKEIIRETSQTKRQKYSGTGRSNFTSQIQLNQAYPKSTLKECYYQVLKGKRQNSQSNKRKEVSNTKDAPILLTANLQTRKE